MGEMTTRRHSHSSAFRTWFKAQFGQLPNDRKRQQIGMKIRNLESEIYHLRQEHQMQIYLQDTFNGALKGWTAK